MTRIVRSGNCRNSPKNQLVEDLAVALLTGDRQAVSGLVTDDVQWTTVGGEAVQGRQALGDSLQGVEPAGIEELVVLHVVTHGKSGAVDGTIVDGGRQQGFCHVFDFANTRGSTVQRITSYRISV